MIHMEYYLVVSTIMMFAGIPPQYAGYPDFRRVDAKRYRYQLCRVQPFYLSGRNGGLFLCIVFHRHLGCGNRNSHRDYD